LTGHQSLGSLGEYLSATESEVLAAINGWPKKNGRYENVASRSDHQRPGPRPMNQTA